MRQQAQGRQRQKVITVAGLRIAAIGGKEKLHQIIRADGQKIQLRQQFIQLPYQSGHFQHGADINFFRHGMAEFDQTVALQHQHVAAFGKFIQCGYQRKHDR